MKYTDTETKVTQAFNFVKSLASNPPGSIVTQGLADHKALIRSVTKIIVSKRDTRVRYGLPASQRALSPGLFIKKFDDIRDCLAGTLGFSCAEREVVLRLLRLYTYYGAVFPKAASIAREPGCSERTFWRAIKKLQSEGLVRVINRFVLRPHAQISNLYRLEKLAIVLARYLAERGTRFCASWLRPALLMPARLFWSFPFQGPGTRASPDQVSMLHSLSVAPTHAG